MADDLRYVRADHLAGIVGVSARTLRRLAAEGVIPSYKLGRSVLFKVEEVIEAIEGEPRE